MKILPPQTTPPSSPTTHHHNPRPVGGKRGYQAYRNCLRTDFGFTCAFCLLHEADVRPGHYDPRYITVEHLLTRKAYPRRANDYTNCVLACSWCNFARGSRPEFSDDGDLLDPTAVPWSDYFQIEDDELIAYPEDVDASYTHWAYDLGDERKAGLRRYRRELIGAHLSFLRQAPRVLTRLSSTIERLQEEGRFQEAAACLEEERLFTTAVLNAIRDLLRYRAKPANAPTVCRCTSEPDFSLPVEFDRQTVDLSELLESFPRTLQGIAARIFAAER